MHRICSRLCGLLLPHHKARLPKRQTKGRRLAAKTPFLAHSSITFQLARNLLTFAEHAGAPGPFLATRASRCRPPSKLHETAVTCHRGCIIILINVRTIKYRKPHELDRYYIGSHVTNDTSSELCPRAAAREVSSAEIPTTPSATFLHPFTVAFFASRHFCRNLKTW
jgi:hypothetical protein